MKRKLPITSSTAPPPLHLATPAHSPGLSPGSTSFKKPLSTLNCQIFRSSENPLPAQARGTDAVLRVINDHHLLPPPPLKGAPHKGKDGFCGVHRHIPSVWKSMWHRAGAL